MIIDFHAHILPGVDHGSRTLYDAKKQFAYMHECGVDRVVAMSHFYPHVHKPKNFIKEVDAAVERLCACSVLPEGIDLCVGAEVLDRKSVV